MSGLRAKFWKVIGLLLVLIGLVTGCGAYVIDSVSTTETPTTRSTEPVGPEIPEQETSAEEIAVEKDHPYYSVEEVAAYLHRFGTLPVNYLTKKEAQKRGWDAQSGNLWEVTDKGVIGGDRFGNREGNLPEKKGRNYFEADVNYNGGRRGAHRLVYSSDGLIYYTADHYETFELLYRGDQ